MIEERTGRIRGRSAHSPIRLPQSASVEAYPCETAPFSPALLREKLRIPRHLGFIPDGNRRWAEKRGLSKAEGYAAGVEPGLQLLDLCRELGVAEVSIYGFTQDNTRRAREQTQAFQSACVQFAEQVARRGMSLYAVGNSTSPLFPAELLPYAAPPLCAAPEQLRVNLLVNYDWEWDLKAMLRCPCEQDAKETAVNTGNSKHPSAKANSSKSNLPKSNPSHGKIAGYLASANVSRMDLIVRWGGRRRLSGFLPIQSVYADVYVEDTLWPDYAPEQFLAALRWYAVQDVTLGG